MIYLYSGILLGQKNEIMPFSATWMDPEIITLRDFSQRKTNMISLICRISKKMIQMNLFTKYKLIKNKLMLPKGRGLN